MRHCITWLIVLLGTCAWSQVRFSGTVTDAASRMPIDGVSVFVAQTQCGTLTGKSGTFTFSCDGLRLPATLVFRMLGYKEQTVAVERSATGLSIALESVALELPPAVVRAGKADTVWGSETLNVADFSFTSDGLLLLTYEKEDRWKRQEDSKLTLVAGAAVRLVHRDGRETTGPPLPESAEYLYDAYPGAVIAKCHRSRYEIICADGTIGYLPVPDSVFASQVAPVVDTLGSSLVLTSYHPEYPALAYSLYNPADSSSRLIRQVVDEETMALFRSEFKYLHPRQKLEAFRYELKTGMDKEVVAAFMTGFSKSAYYRPPNAPLFVLKDSVWIFDHTHNKRVKYDRQAQAADSLALSYHRMKHPDKWSGKLLQDRSNGLLYTMITRSGIHRIHPVSTDGALGPATQLEFRFVDRVRIHEGWVYYIYRPFESSQKRFLYREPLAR